MEVHLRRQKSGFGFRVLGGDEAGQPVSPETREKARMAMGVEPCHFLLSNPLHTHCVHLTPDLWPLRECWLWLLWCLLLFVKVPKQYFNNELLMYQYNNHFNIHCMRHSHSSIWSHFFGPILPGFNVLHLITDLDRCDHREESSGPGWTLAAWRWAAVCGRDPSGGEATQIRHWSDARGGTERPGESGHQEEGAGSRWGKRGWPKAFFFCEQH